MNAFMYGFIDEMEKAGGIPKGLRKAKGAYASSRKGAHDWGRFAADSLARSKKPTPLKPGEKPPLMRGKVLERSAYADIGLGERARSRSRKELKKGRG